MEEEFSTKPKVAIIGSGVIGLLSARHLHSFCDVKVFETRNSLGGLWNYTEENESNYSDLSQNAYYKKYGCLSPSLYPYMTTIVPKYLMLLKDFPSEENLYKCIPSQEYYEYLCDYAKHFELAKHITFNTTVTRVKADNERNQIMVKSTQTNLTDAIESIEYFDYVMVCTGRFSVPNIPKFVGYEDYDGTTFHMHELRKLDPEVFDGKNILIVGSGMSAMDLICMIFLKPECCELVKPNKVYVTSRRTTWYESSEDIRPLIDEGKLEIKKGCISEMKSDKQILFGDGSQETIDTVIYCTGYHISLPFIDSDDDILEFESRDDRCTYVGPLYKKIFAAKEPRIMFPGLVIGHFLANALLEKQVMVCAQFIKGKIQLPSTEEMIYEVTDENAIYTENNENFLICGKINKEFNYYSDIAKLSNLKEDKRYYDFNSARDYFFEVIGKGNVLQARNLDYKTLFDGKSFYPTSELL